MPLEDIRCTLALCPNREAREEAALRLRRRTFEPLLGRAGLSDIRFHDLRHTCAILLLTQAVHPKIVSEMLGHANISITLDTYSHVIPGLGDAAAEAMEEALDGGHIAERASDKGND